MPKSFFPTRQGDLDAWEHNFLTQIGPIATSLGFPQSEITQVTSAVSAHRMAFSEMNMKRQEAQAATAKHEQKRDVARNLLSRFIQIIKNNPSYTEEMGHILGIIGNAEPEKDEGIPTLQLSSSGGEIVIKFRKGRWSGIKIYSRRGSESEFTFLANDTSSPYIDNRPNIVAAIPEKREYYAYYLDKDDQVGYPSDVAFIIT